MSNFGDETDELLSDFQKQTHEWIDMAFEYTSNHPFLRPSKAILREVKTGIKNVMANTPDERAFVTYIKEVDKWGAELKKRGVELPSRIRVALSIMGKNRNE